MNDAVITEDVSLVERAYRIRRNALLMGEVQGQGYIGQALDIADVLAVAYFGAMRYRPQDPEWEERDRFLERALCDRALRSAVRGGHLARRRARNLRQRR
jgi:transketolase N-terminal domain/subunit